MNIHIEGFSGFIAPQLIAALLVTVLGPVLLLIIGVLNRALLHARFMEVNALDDEAFRLQCGDLPEETMSARRREWRTLTQAHRIHSRVSSWPELGLRLSAYQKFALFFADIFQRLVKWELYVVVAVSARALGEWVRPTGELLPGLVFVGLVTTNLVWAGLILHEAWCNIRDNRALTRYEQALRRKLELWQADVPDPQVRPAPPPDKSEIRWQAARSD